MEREEKIVKNRLELLEINEKVQMAKSLLIILETDMCEEKVDEVYIDTVKITHQILKNVQSDLKILLETGEESTQ